MTEIVWGPDGLGSAARHRISTTDAVTVAENPRALSVERTLSVEFARSRWWIGNAPEAGIVITVIGERLPRSVSYEITTVRPASDDEAAKEPTMTPASFDPASFDPATADDEQIRAYARSGGSVIPLLEAGRAVIVDNTDMGPTRDPAEVPMLVRSLRIPVGLYQAAVAAEHPNGFSGVVRDALAAYLAEPQADDVRHAMAVLVRAVARLDDGA